MKVAELSDMALDYWVCRALLAQFEGQQLTLEVMEQIKHLIGALPFRPSTDWAQGGAIIGRENIGFAQMAFRGSPGGWTAYVNARGTVIGLDGDFNADGPTQLIAAMRAYVTSKFGDEVGDVSLPETD
ncbi:DUF2591 family protein [Burkholderia vietnamiensis]|uniref:phage protein NinX family protein n=1 Tax=Burkholderia TaxID=32008 RepID=UPI002654961F|nr:MULTISPECIES: phage protein NinX family protein [Burkholderia]MDN7429012.1 DUF2591 family protein [Burkholderia sp. AU45388]MDN7553141.1 DUF2591 family protein [Burkholderia vietnamiensis]HDR9093362.1 DUF2591 family protein [Burkholderia vietnamiensis]